MKETDRPTRHPAVETAVFESEVVVYDDRSGMVHQLNPSASAIWRLLDGRALAAVIDTLEGATGVPRDDLRSDVIQAIEAFRAADLLAD